jgi:Zn-dependent protease
MGGSIRLFRVAGIQVSLHFSWFLVAAYQLTARRYGYRDPMFALYEYMALFGIVLLHEFGHALACRQTGGTANYILLWPFGGVAFVRPPERPGAQLWSIAAGPLVNVALIPVFEIALFSLAQSGTAFRSPDLFHFVGMLRLINYALLIFNLLPIYPLDGGQILRSLLWFPLGRIRSLKIAAAIGLVGGVVAGIAAVYYLRSIWMAILGFFLVSQAWTGWKHAQSLAHEEAELKRVPDDPGRPPVL